MIKKGNNTIPIIKEDEKIVDFRREVKEIKEV